MVAIEVASVGEGTKLDMEEGRERIGVSTKTETIYITSWVGMRQ